MPALVLFNFKIIRSYFVKVKRYKTALTRLKCSSHRLEMESGSWHKSIRTPTGQRLCKICNVIENDFFFFFFFYYYYFILFYLFV